MSIYCEVRDLLLEVVDLKQEAPALRSGGIHPNLTPAYDRVVASVCIGCCCNSTQHPRIFNSTELQNVNVNAIYIM